MPTYSFLRRSYGIRKPILSSWKYGLRIPHLACSFLNVQIRLGYGAAVQRAILILGIRRNIESLLGASVWLWWWSCHALRNGTSFPIAESSGQSSNLSLHNVDMSVEELWPSRDSHGNEHGIKNPASCPVGEMVAHNLNTTHYSDRNYHDSVSLKPRRAILFTASFTTDENQAE